MRLLVKVRQFDPGYGRIEADPFLPSDAGPQSVRQAELQIGGGNAGLPHMPPAGAM